MSIIGKIFLLITFLFWGNSMAQVKGGKIDGYVYNLQGKPISDAYVVIPTLGLADVTSNNGYYIIEHIRPGSYSIKFDHISFSAKIVDNIVVRESFTTTLDTIILESHIYDVSDITVTATRSQRSTPFISSQINSVSLSQIKARNAKTSAEALREETGIFVQKTNHGGGSAVIRGLSSNQILILVDGIRLNNSTYRLGNHQYLTTIDNLIVDQIEVVRGPTSVLYGSDALGGTINVITKHPIPYSSGFDMDFRLYSRFASADFEKTARTEVALRYHRFALLGGFSFKHYDDLTRGRKSKHPQIEKSTNGYKQTPSGFKSYDFDTKFLYGLTSSQTLTLTYQMTRQIDVPRYDKYESDGYLRWIYKPQNRRLIYLKYDNYLNNKILQSLQATISQHSQEEGREIQKSIDLPMTKEHDQVNTLGFSLQTSSIQDKHEITLGWELYRDKVSSKRSNTYPDSDSTIQDVRGRYPDNAKYTSLGIFTQDEIKLSSKWRVTLGARFSYMQTSFYLNQTLFTPQIGELYEQSFKSLTASIGNVFELKKEIHMKAHIAQAFRAPNLSDLAKLGESKGTIIEIPNQDLKPEKLVSLDFAVDINYPALRAKVAVFYTNIRDLIASADATLNDTQIDTTIYKIKSKQNVGQAYIRGIEIGFEYNPFKKILFYTNITSTFGQNITLNEPVDGIPPTFGLAGLKWLSPDYYFDLYIRFASKQNRLSTDDRDDPRIPIGGTPGWKIVNFKAGFKFLETVDLRLTVENIFDINYREHGSGINGPGRNFILGMELKF